METKRKEIWEEESEVYYSQSLYTGQRHALSATTFIINGDKEKEIWEEEGEVYYSQSLNPGQAPYSVLGWVNKVYGATIEERSRNSNIWYSLHNVIKYKWTKGFQS